MNQEELKNTKGPLVYVATRDDGMRYIGVTRKTINQRYSSKADSHYFTRAYHKARDRFTWEIIPCDSEADAYELESLMVDEGVVNNPNFFNLSLGGRYNTNHSEAARAKMRDVNIGNTNASGFKHNQEFCDRSSRCMKGKQHALGIIRTDGVRLKMSRGQRPQGFPDVISPDGVVYEVINASQFSREHNLNSSSLIALMNGRQNSTKGWRLAPSTNQEGN